MLPKKVEPILDALFGQSPVDAERRSALRDAFKAALLESSAGNLHSAEVDPAGARWTTTGDQFAIDKSVQADDQRAAEDPRRKQLQAALGSFAVELAENSKRLGNSPQWGGIPSVASNLVKVLEEDGATIVEQLGTVYAIMLRLGGYLEASDSVAEPSERLDLHTRRILVDVVRIGAPWLRGFPSVAEWDDEAGKTLTRNALLNPAREFVAVARSTGVISAQDQAELQLLADGSQVVGFQASKAGRRAVGTARNLLLAAVEAAADGAVSTATGGGAVRAISQKAAETLHLAQRHVKAFAEAMPSDVRQAIDLLIDDPPPIQDPEIHPARELPPNIGLTSELSSRISPHLPYARRFAREVRGEHADDDVTVVIENLIKGELRISDPEDVRLSLYRFLVQEWEGLDANEKIAHVLFTDIGLREDQVATVMGTTSDDALNLARSYAAKLIGIDTSVLMVEDEPLAAMDLEAFLEKWGYRPIGIARTAAEAVDASISLRPKLIVMDIQLADGSSGIDAANEILKHYRPAIVFITSYPERLLTGNRPEPTYLVTKPWSPDVLQGLLADAVAESVQP